MNKEKVLQELQFKAVRSFGAGGQHVNKVSSKVELYFNLKESSCFTVKEKELLFTKLSNRISKEGVIILTIDKSRSQHKNKELTIKLFFNLIKEGLKVPKKRKPIKISKALKKKRLDEKQKQSVKKNLRKKPKID